MIINVLVRRESAVKLVRLSKANRNCRMPTGTNSPPPTPPRDRRRRPESPRRVQFPAGGKKDVRKRRAKPEYVWKQIKRRHLGRKIKRHFYITERHFIQMDTFFAETVGLLVAIRALRIEFLRSKCAGSRHGHLARKWNMPGRPWHKGDATTSHVPRDVLETKSVSCLLWKPWENLCHWT